jgi:hypothetical protein
VSREERLRRYQNLIADPEMNASALRIAGVVACTKTADGRALLPVKEIVPYRMEPSPHLPRWRYAANGFAFVPRTLPCPRTSHGNKSVPLLHARHRLQ